MRAARKIAALAVAVLMGLGMSVAIGTPAQAWGYCHGGNPPSVNGRFNFYSSQGYCGSHGYNGSPLAPGVCYTMVGIGYNDWMAAVWNRTGYIWTIFQNDDCSYGYAWKDIGAGKSDPDLYPDNLFRNVSSVKMQP